MQFIGNIIERQDGGWRKECIHCGSEYESVREDSLYCGASCRKRAQRAEKRKANAREKFNELMQQIMDNSDIEDIQAMIKAHKQIGGFLAVRGLANISAEYVTPEKK